MVSSPWSVFATGLTHDRITVWISEWVLFDIRTRLFSHVQRLSPAFYGRHQTGRTMSRVQNDVQELEESLSILTLTVANFLTVLIIAAAMLTLDALLAATTLALVALLIPGLVLWRRLAHRPFRRARETIAEVNSSIQENVAGIRVVQSLNRQEAEQPQLPRGEPGEPRGRAEIRALPLRPGSVR